MWSYIICFSIIVEGFIKASNELQQHQQLLKEHSQSEKSIDSEAESDDMKDVEIREVTSSVNSSRRSSIKVFH